MHSYKAVNAGGWDATDTVSFELPTLSADTILTATVEVRTTEEYPYNNLAVQAIVLCNGREVARTDLSGDIYDSQGKATGSGFPFATNALTPTFPVHLMSDSTYILCITHQMRANPIVGISDIGVKLTTGAE